MAHTFTNLLTHIIFSTKERIPCLEPDFKEELIAFLKKHEVEYDERYLWD